MTDHNLLLAKDAVIARLRAELEAARAENLKERDALHQMARAVEQSPASIVITDRARNIQYVDAYFEHVGASVTFVGCGTGGW